MGLAVNRDLEVVDPASTIELRSLARKEDRRRPVAAGKSFLAEAEFRGSDSLDLDCHWVPLATTRRFLRDHRDTARRIASIYAESARLFKSQPQETVKEISRWLPALADHPKVVEKCYALFATEFEPTLAPSMDSIQSILREVALQDGRAGDLKPADLVENLL
jgi:ABC-type nitrate/sulfonate/bicarbonate transport system substrate-binding protein